MPTVSIDKVIIPSDDTLIPRLREEAYLQTEYKQAFLGYGGWGEFPPITVDQDYLILDGVTRILAAIAAEVQNVNVTIVHCETQGERLSIAASANATHGKRWETKDLVRLSNLAEKYGLSQEDLAQALRVPVSKIERVPVATVVRSTVGGAEDRERIYVKRALRQALVGREITQREEEVMNGLSTANQAQTILEDFLRIAELNALPPLNAGSMAIAEQVKEVIDRWIERDSHLL